MLLNKRTHALLKRHRRRGSAPSLREVQDLYTDACAEILRLQAEYLRTRRRVSADADAASDEDERADELLSELEGHRFELLSELEAVAKSARHLRVALEWLQEDAEDGSSP